MDDPALTTSQNLVPLLTTKLRAPPLRAGLVSRPRLIDRLNAGLHCRFTLVSAPAGFGKTTLLSEWASSCRYNVAWLSLDAGDSDVHRFLSHLVASVQTVAARVGQWISHTLQASGTIDAEAALIALINDIASIPGGLILVLDDYHVIESSLVDQAVGFLVDHLPPPQEGVHLIIASRINPSLPLSRLRASGHMSEIRERDLRFTVDEASAFLEAVLGDRLTAEDVVTLETRTEGWIAGLQLAALSMQGLEDDRELAAFVGRFAGSHHYIQDYLADEVLKRQSQSTRDFLLQTSILERLSGPLCDFVRFGSPDVPHGETDSQTMLEDLEVSNLFLVPLDGERCWYRYHHLFADLLRARASRIYPDSQRQLHLRAADWLESMRMMSHAVHHALLAEDHDRAASLLEEAVSGTMLHGRLNTIFKWLDALPESVLNAHPRLRFYQAWALSLTGQPKVAEQMIARARTSLGALPQTARTSALRGELAALRTAIIIHRNEPEEIRREAHEALTYLPEGDVTSRSRVQIALGAAHAYSDEPQKAMQAFERARDLALRAKNPFLASVTLEQLAEPQIYHLGRLREATQNLLQILELGRANDGTMHPHAGTAHILLAEIQLEWNDLEKASEYLDAGFNLLNRGGIGYALTHCYCTEARYALAVDDSDRAVEAMRAAARAVQTSPLLHFQVRNLACQVKVALRLGDIEGASRWASGAMCDLPTSLPSDQREVWQIALARVSLARGEWQIAIRTLSKVIAQAAHGRRMAIALEACLLKSLASRELGRDDEAIESLQMALSAAAPESYTLTFVEHGEPMIRLLVEASAREIMPDYVSGLIAAFPSAARNTAASQSQPLVEPLSPRELEVLHLIAQGLSNHEIAGRLFLALDTVKGHNYRIYGKLGVRRRTAAVSRARELGLV